MLGRAVFDRLFTFRIGVGRMEPMKMIFLITAASFRIQNIYTPKEVHVRSSFKHLSSYTTKLQVYILSDFLGLNELKDF